jgi:hypothetical protein
VLSDERNVLPAVSEGGASREDTRRRVLNGRETQEALELGGRRRLRVEDLRWIPRPP